LVRYALAIPRQLHNLPKHLEQLLPKYDLETSGLLEYHIKKCIISMRLLNVQFEDVVCHLFIYTFENSYSTWCFSLHVASITNWTEFQKSFIGKFGKETTTCALMVELFSLTIGPKESVKDINQIFTTILNKF
jgi:hypothetical protein